MTEQIINEFTINKKIKWVTRKTFDSLTVINQNNYMKTFEDSQVMFEKIFKTIEENNINKSLFLDFMNYVTEIKYLYEMMTLNDMKNKEIQQLLTKEKDYITSLYLNIQAITVNELRA
jgi:uncharacterized membrane protein YwzB